MALINCPECDKLISDQAHNCIQCGFPLASKNNWHKREDFPADFSPPPNPALANKELIVAIVSKKSEGLAFLFTFLFGPLGLFYADAKKAIALFVIAVIAGFLTLVIDESGSIYVIIIVVFWIISIILAMTSVADFNSKITSGLSAGDPVLAEAVPALSTDPVHKLNQLLLVVQNNPSVAGSYKAPIINLISEICTNKSDCYFLLKEYKHRYSTNLIEELKNLSNSYDTIKNYLKPFIDFGIVNKEYPHNPV